jgi:uncharacterized protein (TIGR02246 family)
MRQLLALVAILVAFTWACESPAARPLTDGDVRTITDAVHEVMNGYLDALNALDSTRVFSFYASDPDLRFYEGAKLLNREQSLAMVRDFLTSSRRFEGRFNSVRVTALARNAALAVADGVESITDSTGAVTRQRFANTWVLVRREGGWKFIHPHVVYTPDAGSGVTGPVSAPTK